MRRDPHDPAAAVMVASILDAAERVLEANGRAGLTTNRVSEKAGVSIGSLYQYFPNKEAIAAGLFERYLQIYVKIFLDTMSAPGTYADAVERLIRAMIVTYFKQPQIHRYLYEMRDDADMHGRIRESLDLCVQAISNMLRAGGLDEPRATGIGFVLVHACDGVCTAAYQRGVTETDSLAEPFITMVRGYLEKLGVGDRRIG